MGQATLERSTFTPDLPRIDTVWARHDAVGNGWRKEQLGGPQMGTSATAIERASHGHASGMLPRIAPSGGISSEVDTTNHRVWLTGHVGLAGGAYIPGVGLSASLKQVGIDNLTGGSAGAGFDASMSVSIGLPLTRCSDMTAADCSPVPAGELATLMGISPQSWAAAFAVAGGDLSRVGELPAGAAVRSGRSLGMRLDTDKSPFGDLVPLAPTLDLQAGLSSGVEVQRVGEAVVVRVRIDLRASGALGLKLGSMVPGMGFAASGGRERAHQQDVTLTAHASDRSAMATLSAVIRSARNNSPDPIASVSGAAGLVKARTQTDEFGSSTHVGALMNSLTFDDTSREEFTLTEDEDSFSAHGSGRAEYQAGLQIDNSVSRQHRLDGPIAEGTIGGGAEWDAVNGEAAMRLSGGTAGTPLSVSAITTQIRLGPSDVEALVCLARSANLWASMCLELRLLDGWLALRTQVLAPRVSEELRARHPGFALQATQLQAISHFVASDSAAIDVLRNAVGRGNGDQGVAALGVLEWWSADTQAVRDEYEAIGSWLDAMSRGMWDSVDPIDLLLDLGDRADRLYGQIESFTHVPERARLEMLGQVTAWQDAIDEAWCRTSDPHATCVEAPSHRPTSVTRLEKLAEECRSEAAPHLHVLAPLLCRPCDLTDPIRSSFESLSGILAYWRRVAGDLRRACEEAGLPEVAWRVRGRDDEERRELDPELDLWHMIRDVYLDRGPATAASVAALQLSAATSPPT